MHFCVKYDVSDANISGVTGLGVEKIGQTWLPKEEYGFPMKMYEYCPKY